MSLTRCTELSAADWLVRSPTEAHRLITVGPDGFEAYTQIPYAEDGPSDLEVAREVLHRLAGFTSTGNDCYFCAWDGYGDLEPGPLLHDLPYRHFALYRGPLQAIDGWPRDFPPAMVWPADRAWFFASDVDPDWASVGGSAAAVSAVAR